MHMQCLDGRGKKRGRADKSTEQMDEEPIAEILAKAKVYAAWCI